MPSSPINTNPNEVIRKANILDNSQPIIDKIRQKPQIPLILTTILIASLILAVYLARTRQQIDQQAAPVVPITLSFSPPSLTLQPNQTATVKILANTSSNLLSAIDLDLLLANSNIAIFDQITKGPALAQELPSTGGITVNPANASLALGALCTASSSAGCASASGPDLEIATIHIKSTNTGINTLSFAPTSIASALGVSENVLSPSLPTLTISVVGPVTSGPTATPTITRPSPTKATTPTVIPPISATPTLAQDIPTATPTPATTGKPQYPGDANGDGKVDILDYSILFAHYNEEPLVDKRADFNKDNHINILDYSILFAHYGENSLTPTPVI